MTSELASTASATASSAMKATSSVLQSSASTTQDALEKLAHSAKSRAGEMASKLGDLAKTGDWLEAPERLQRLVTGRSEASLILLALEYFFVKSAPSSSSSLFGRILLGANGYNLVVFALKDKASKVWKDAAGLKLDGPDAEALGSLTLTALAVPGVLACASAVTGPEKHPFSVLGLAVIKLVLGVFFAIRGDAAKAGGNANVGELAKYHARTGLALLAFGVMLLWRGRGISDAPRYAVEMESRLAERLEQLIAVVKDQKSRLDELNGTAPSTPKKY